MEFDWVNKKGSISTHIGSGTDLEYWGLPFSLRIQCGKYNTKIHTAKDGTITFEKIKPSGWFFFPYVRFLCFYFYIEFERWYV